MSDQDTTYKVVVGEAPPDEFSKGELQAYGVGEGTPFVYGWIRQRGNGDWVYGIVEIDLSGCIYSGPRSVRRTRDGAIMAVTGQFSRWRQLEMEWFDNVGNSDS